MVADEVLMDADGVSRRDFLRAGSVAVVGLSGSKSNVIVTAHPNRRAIFITMTGGASQLETFDPKPEAPSNIRGPFKSIETRIAGVRFSETLPRLAERSNRLAVIRSMNHDAAPLHETGQQLLQTGQLSYRKVQFPHWGAVVAKCVAGRANVPTNVILPNLVSDTGVNAYRGQSAGILGSEWNPVVDSLASNDDQESLRRHYGDSKFGRMLLRSRQLIERGTRCVTVNLFDSLGQQETWDCHGDKGCGPATLFDYQAKLCPEFDHALAGLIDDLEQRGLLDETLIVVTGEFGRTPCVNENVGRDHWTQCWSAVVAGGRIAGGQVIGSSDSAAAEPTSRPVTPGELTATLQHWCGIDGIDLAVDVDDRPLPLIPHSPVMELWA